MMPHRLFNCHTHTHIYTYTINDNMIFMLVIHITLANAEIIYGRIYKIGIVILLYIIFKY